jgi:hypothetical protein
MNSWRLRRVLPFAFSGSFGQEGEAWYDALASKLTIRYPNMPMPQGPDVFKENEDDPVRLVFVGNHFGRKGGSVALRLAETDILNSPSRVVNPSISPIDGYRRIAGFF